jgi:hypothetical protein
MAHRIKRVLQRAADAYENSSAYKAYNHPGENRMIPPRKPEPENPTFDPKRVAYFVDEQLKKD